MADPTIVIVGGAAGGASAATRARRMNESAKIVLLEKGEHVSFANCGLPYHIAGQIADRDRLLMATSRSLRSAFNLDVRTGHEVVRIDRAGRNVEVINSAAGERYFQPYDTLILSPGAAPVVPPWKGIDRSNVFTLRDIADMDRIKTFIDAYKPKRAAVIGAGLIGLEMVEALVERNVEVAVVEQMPQLLPLLDPEMAREIENLLCSRGVELHLGVGTEGLMIDVDGQRAIGVRLDDRREVPADLVLVSIGIRPVVKLAEEAGLTLGPTGGIAVDKHLQTNDPHILAVGDATETVHWVTGEPVRIPLAGPANRNGRLAGTRAATGKTWTATPVLGTAIVGLFGQVAAMTGLSAKAARELGISHAVSYAIRPHHAGFYPGAQPMILKLVYAPDTGRILGGQAVGGAGVDKRIDVIATTIHFRGTVDDLAGLDLAYAPQFGSAKDPVHIAAFVAQNERAGLLSQIAPGESVPEGQLLDVRNPNEIVKGTFPGAINIPLTKLRTRIGELDRSKPVVVFCQVGERSYNAARILLQSGFAEVWHLAGGYQLHKSTVS